MKVKTLWLKVFALLVPAIMVTAIACTPAQAQTLEGVLKNIDSVNGKITVVTKDGKTVDITIDTRTTVNTADNKTADLGVLAPGAQVKVKVRGNGQVAERVEARQAEVEGVITAITGNDITIQPEKGDAVIIHVSDSTRIKLDDDENDLPAKLTDLKVGQAVEAKFDPDSKAALKIKLAKPEDEATKSKGAIEVRVTDAPRSDNITEIWVTVAGKDGVQVHRAGDEQGSDNQTQEQERGREREQQRQDSDNQSEEQQGEWITIPLTGPNPFDLLKLKGTGLQEVLATANITAGKYTQIRMTIESIQVKWGNGSTDNATIPSGKLKFVHPFDVAVGKTTILLFDFDAGKSVNVTGGGKVMFKPVIKLSVTRTPGQMEITTTSLPNGGIGATYNATLSAFGGQIPYSWSVTGGTLPPGLTLAALTGAVTGTPTQAGDFAFTVKVEDSSAAKKSASKSLTINIAPAGTLQITTTNLPDGMVNVAYNATLQTIGGTSPYTWAMATGMLPAGLTLDVATGIISGTPTAKGDFSFTVKVTDSSTPTANTDTQNLTLHIDKDVSE